MAKEGAWGEKAGNRRLRNPRATNHPPTHLEKKADKRGNRSHVNGVEPCVVYAIRFPHEVLKASDDPRQVNQDADPLQGVEHLGSPDLGLELGVHAEKAESRGHVRTGEPCEETQHLHREEEGRAA